MKRWPIVRHIRYLIEAATLGVEGDCIAQCGVLIGLSETGRQWASDWMRRRDRLSDIWAGRA